MTSIGKAPDGLEELESDRKSAEFFAKDLQNGFAYCKIVTDRNGKPVDYVYVYVNDAYVEITGSKREVVLGKRATELFPTLVNDPVDWIGKYGKVAITGEPTRFDAMLQFRKVWYSLSVYSPKRWYFAVIFDDVTDRKKAEEALERSNQKTNEILESIKDYFYSLDRDWNFIYVNKLVATLLGKDPKDLIGHNIWKIFPKGLGTAFEENYRAAMENRQTRRFETPGFHASAWLMITVFPSVDGISAMASDITERKKAEETLKTTLDRFYGSLSSMHGAILLVSPAGSVEFANQSFIEYFNLKESTSELRGLSSEEVIQKIKSGYLNPEQAAIRISEIVANGKPVIGEEVAMQNGRTCLRDFIPLTNTGKSMSRIWHHTDITKQKIAEEALKESEERWETTLASIGDAVIATDTSGKIIFMNAEAEELTGWKLSETLHKQTKEVFNIVNEQTRLEVENPIDRVLKEGMVVGLANHTVLIRKDGSEVPIDDSGAPIKDKEGKTTGVVLIFRDITERKKAEDALILSEKRYRELFNSMAEMFQVIELIFDKDGEAVDFYYRDVNPALERFAGKTREQLVGKSSKEVFGSVEIYWLDVWAKVAKTGEPIHYENYGAAINKYYYTYAWKAKENEVAVIISDITERKQAALKLEEYRNSLEKLVEERTKKLEISSLYARNLIEASLDPLVTISADGKITDVNKATEQVTGCSKRAVDWQ